MTSLRQIEANRRNASKSTGPSTEAGKERSRRNAVRHGLTAETVIGSLEDAEDYKLFEAAVTVDFNPETAIERELVLRVASLLWRLRRATSIETGMFQNSADSTVAADEKTDSLPKAVAVAAVNVGSLSHPADPTPTWRGGPQDCAQLLHSTDNPGCLQNLPSDDTNAISHLAHRFLNLAAEDKGAFERLGRYETTLWRQVCQTIFMLEVLRRQAHDMKWLPRPAHPGSSRSFLLSTLARR